MFPSASSRCCLECGSRLTLVHFTRFQTHGTWEFNSLLSRPMLYRLRRRRRLDALAVRQVGERVRKLQDKVVGAGTQVHLLHRGLDELPLREEFDDERHGFLLTLDKGNCLEKSI